MVLSVKKEYFGEMAVGLVGLLDGQKGESRLALKQLAVSGQFDSQAALQRGDNVAVKFGQEFILKRFDCGVLP